MNISAVFLPPTRYDFAHLAGHFHLNLNSALRFRRNLNFADHLAAGWFCCRGDNCPRKEDEGGSAIEIASNLSPIVPTLSRFLSACRESNRFNPQHTAFLIVKTAWTFPVPESPVLVPTQTTLRFNDQSQIFGVP
jgi:hypothetical protein